MGWAMWARVAQLLGCKSYGTELSLPRVHYARKCGVEVLQLDSLPPERFDFVNTEQVMEHLPDFRTAADRLARSLRPGGILKISVPSADGIERTLWKLQHGRALTDAEFVPIQPLEHVNSFTARSLFKFSAGLGLKQVRPTLRQRYSFLGRTGALSLRRPKNALKELARPFYTFSNRRNLYVWLQRPVR
jgi:SAM-dependent methyltransferase